MLAGEGQGACWTEAFSLNATMVWWSAGAGAVFGCFYVAELLWVLVVRLSCKLAKTMRSFTCEYMTFSAIEFSFPRLSKFISHKLKYYKCSTNNQGKTLNIVCGMVVKRLKRWQARASELLKTTEKFFTGSLGLYDCISNPKFTQWIQSYLNKSLL